MAISARNVLQGTITSVEHGALNTEVVVELPDGTEIVSIITLRSAKELGLEVGKTVNAVVKASNVMISAE